MSKVKICGLSRMKDIETVNRALPDFAGFVFAPSRRRVEMGMAAALKKELDARISVVGVFVNEDIDIISDIYKSGVIDMVQLHGDEDDEYIGRLKERCACRVIKAVGIGNTLPPLPALPDYLLFDTISQQRGGTGVSFDWNVLREYRGSAYFLAGGLTIQNVGGSLRTLSPFCVDVSSGVETNGMKDAAKIEKFVQIVRGNQR